MGLCSVEWGVFVRCNQDLRSGGRRAGEGRPQLHRHPRRILAPLAALAVAGSLGLAGCNSIYLHSADNQKAMEQARAGFDAARKSQLEALAAQNMALAELNVRQRTTEIRWEFADRDFAVARILDGEQTARTEAGDMLQGLIGTSTAPQVWRRVPPTGATEPTPMATFLEDYAKHQRQMAQRRQTADRSATAFIARGGKVRNACDERGAPLRPGVDYDVPAGNAKAAEAAKTYADDCHTLQVAWANTLGQWEQTTASGSSPAFQHQPAVARCILGVPGACGGNGTLYPDFAEHHAAQQLISDAQKAAAAAKANLEALQLSYECAKKQEQAPGPSDGVRQVARVIQDFIEALPSDGAAVSTTLATAPPATPAAALPANCPGGATEALTFAALLTRAGIEPAQLKQGLEAARSAPGAAGIAAALTKAKNEFAESRLATVLKAIAPPPPAPAGSPAATDARTEKPDPVAIAAAGVVAAMNPIWRIARSRSEDLPDSRSVLIDLAVARHAQNTAQIELDRLKEAARLLRLRADARLMQLSDLNAAMAERNTTRSTLLLASSWSRGAVPAVAAKADLDGLNDRALLAREEAGVNANYAVLDPLISQLQIYAAGGIDAEMIARAISAAALVAVAVGVN
ncbi:MAG: hypothetical protein IPK78_20590 [Rhodospirillales bacterium]|nr:hypothetical protein [Rhodospirillales bacterium]